MVPFLLLRAPTHQRFTFDLRFLFEMKHKVDLFKSVCRIFHFRFLCFIFIMTYVFDQQKTWKYTHSFAFKSSIFKLQKEVFFFYLGFLSCTFTIHRRLLQRAHLCTHSQQPDSNREPLVSEKKSLTTKRTTKIQWYLPTYLFL